MLNLFFSRFLDALTNRRRAAAEASAPVPSAAIPNTTQPIPQLNLQTNTNSNADTSVVDGNSLIFYVKFYLVVQICLLNRSTIGILIAK